MLISDKHSLRLLGLGLIAAGLIAGCNGPTTDAEEISETVQAVNICNETVPANRNVDGIPAYAQCTTTTGSIYSNNGVDTATTSGGTGWVRTQSSGGYQCTELAHRYFYFHWNVSWIPNGNAGTWCDTVPPASSGVVQTTTPVHGDLIVFAPGVCGADATTGHVAVIDVVVNATTLTIVEQNSASRRNTQQSCATCFLHVVANTGTGGSGGASSTGGATSAGGANAGGLTAAGGSAVTNTGGRMSTGGAKATGGVATTGGNAAAGGSSPITGGATNNVAGSPSGGSPSTGGNAATGGQVAATGGHLSTGGAIAIGTGGAIAAAGGNAEMGGSLGTGGFTSANSLPSGGSLAGTGGNATAADSGTGTPADPGDSGSCGCRVAGQPTHLAGYYGLGLLGLIARRRRQRAHERP